MASLEKLRKRQDSSLEPIPGKPSYFMQLRNRSRESVAGKFETAVPKSHEMTF